MTCWEQLGISPTTDAKTIKKAYAEKVKTCHQEDNPELWAQLHDAYMQAVKYAQTDGRIPLHPYVVVSEQKRTKERSLEQEQTGKAKEAREQQRFAEYTAEQDDRRMEQLFDQLRENERQAKRADMEELRGQIEKHPRRHLHLRTRTDEHRIAPRPPLSSRTRAPRPEISFQRLPLRRLPESGGGGRKLTPPTTSAYQMMAIRRTSLPHTEVRRFFGLRRRTARSSWRKRYPWWSSFPPLGDEIQVF